MRNFLRSRNLSRQMQEGAHFGKNGKKAGNFFPAFLPCPYSLNTDTALLETYIKMLSSLLSTFTISSSTFFSHAALFMQVVN